MHDSLTPPRSRTVACNAKVVLITTIAKKTEIQLDKTCFCPRINGQDGDIGTLMSRSGALFEVTQVRSGRQGVVRHFGTLRSGELHSEDQVYCLVNEGRRKINTWLHSAGHVVALATAQLRPSWQRSRDTQYPTSSFVAFRGRLLPGEQTALCQQIEAKTNQLLASHPTIRTIGDHCPALHTADLEICKPITITKITAKNENIRISYSIGGNPPFHDRGDAGRQLSSRLATCKGQDAIVYALPRGGAVVGAEVAKQLGLPLELIITRKIGHAASPEETIGAVDETGKVLWGAKAPVGIPKTLLAQTIRQERAEVRRRQKIYLHGRRRTPATGKIAIIVDDGAATGLTIIAAIISLRAEQPKQIVVALPVASQPAVTVLKKHTNAIYCLRMLSPAHFTFVAVNYQAFPEVTDADMLAAIKGVQIV